MLNIEGLTVGYGQKAILKNINFTVVSPSLIAVTGKNGQGKTTVLKTIAGLLPALNGSIEIDGIEIQNISFSQKARLITYLNPNWQPAMKMLTVEQIVSLGTYSAPQSNAKKLVYNAMELTGIQNLAHRLFYQLSDGQKQKTLIAKAIAQDTSVLLLDEPLAYLDYIAKHQILDILRNLAHKKQKIIVYSTHDIEAALQKTEKFIFVDSQTAKLIDKKSLIAAIDAQINTIYAE